VPWKIHRRKLIKREGILGAAYIYLGCTLSKVGDDNSDNGIWGLKGKGSMGKLKG